MCRPVYVLLFSYLELLICWNRGVSMYTCSMATYSMTTDPKFILSVINMDTSVDARAIREMNNGPSNLHARSILSMRAFISRYKSANGTVTLTVDKVKGE